MPCSSSSSITTSKRFSSDAICCGSHNPRKGTYRSNLGCVTYVLVLYSIIQIHSVPVVICEAIRIILFRIPVCMIIVDGA